MGILKKIFTKKSLKQNYRIFRFIIQTLWFGTTIQNHALITLYFVIRKNLRNCLRNSHF